MSNTCEKILLANVRYKENCSLGRELLPCFREFSWLSFVYFSFNCRFEVLWQSRYHAWPRLEEGARLILKVRMYPFFFGKRRTLLGFLLVFCTKSLCWVFDYLTFRGSAEGRRGGSFLHTYSGIYISHFDYLPLKVPPPKVDFTLPSPAVGMPSSHPPDCPWDATLILEEQQDKKNRDKRKIRDNGSALKKQQERSEFLLRAIPVSMETTVGVNVAEDEKGELLQCLFHLFQDRIPRCVCKKELVLW